MADGPPSDLLTTLLARFDGTVLRVALPDRASPPLHMPTAAQRRRWESLQRWCLAGSVQVADGGRSPLVKLSVAVWTAEAGSPDDALVDTFSRHLDGSHQLIAAGGALAGLWLRLRVKACDVAWWRPRRATDPWDCGYVVNEPAVRDALARFRPRRATLMVAVGWAEADLNDALALLARSSSLWPHPVRWLAVQGQEQLVGAQSHLGGLRVQRLQPVDAER